MFEDIPTPTEAHALALTCCRAGIAACLPARAVGRHISVEDETVIDIAGTTYDLTEYDQHLILGGGKAADTLTQALLDQCNLSDITGTIVTTAPATSIDAIEVFTGSHPVPGDANLAGTRTILAMAENADSDTVIFVPLTGGASALLCAPAQGLTLAAIQAVTDRLLTAGAPIEELNSVRQMLSRIKGGGLARAAHPATVIGILMSDVVGDDPSIIGSGPTVPTEQTAEKARDILSRYGCTDTAAYSWLTSQNIAASGPTSVTNHVITTNRDALEAARREATDAGYSTCLLSSEIEGEARAVGRIHAAIAREIRQTGNPIDRPAVILSGGETTVTVTGSGTGGPNLETALAALPGLPPDAVFASIDTDGSDGSTPAAGALVDTTMCPDSSRIESALAENDSYTLLAEHDGLLVSGSTGTNVNDLRVLVLPP